MATTLEDIFEDEFYEKQYQEELYENHKQQAIKEFTAERLRSFYIKHPDVMRPAVDMLREAQTLHTLQRHGAALVFAVSGIELLLKATLLQPVVYGLVHHEGLAGVIMNHALGQAGFERYKKLMADLFRNLASLDISGLTRNGSSKPLLAECTELQTLRNRIIHTGATCREPESAHAEIVVIAVYESIVRPMLYALGLDVQEKGIIVPKGNIFNPPS